LQNCKISATVTSPEDWEQVAHDQQAGSLAPLPTVSRKAALIGLSNPPSSHSKVSGLASTTCYKVTNNTLTAYTRSLQPESGEVNSKPGKSPPEDNAPSGEVTEKVSARLKNAVRAWQTRNKLLFYRGRADYDRLNLITLTLPAEQEHGDRFIKDKPLRALLNRLEKDYKCENWVWKGERQGNGNLHFHILVDRYIPWKLLRNLWNSQLQRHGYIDAYEKTWREWDKHGFRFSQNLAKQGMNYQKQLKAYYSRLEHGYRNPNTTDIHATRKVRNLESYFVKYIAKSDGSRIDGKVWGYSESVREMSNYKTDTNNRIESLKTEIHQKAKDPENKEFTAFEDDYFTVYSGPVLKLIRENYPDILNQMTANVIEAPPPLTES
jgi:hypothetical protein